MSLVSFSAVGHVGRSAKAEGTASGDGGGVGAGCLLERACEQAVNDDGAVATAPAAAAVRKVRRRMGLLAVGGYGWSQSCPGAPGRRWGALPAPRG